MNCIWSIRLDKGSHIILTFNDFDFPPPDENMICSDYLDIWDSAAVGNGNQINRFCGSKRPNPVESSRHSLR